MPLPSRRPPGKGMRCLHSSGRRRQATVVVPPPARSNNHRRWLWTSTTMLIIVPLCFFFFLAESVSCFVSILPCCDKFQYAKSIQRIAGSSKQQQIGDKQEQPARTSSNSVVVGNRRPSFFLCSSSLTDDSLVQPQQQSSAAASLSSAPLNGEARTATTAIDSTRKNKPTSSSSSSSFSDHLQRLKESVDIVDVVESYGLAGFRRHHDGSAVAVCPFHDDHNPSLRVDSGRQSYKCFACGAGGDVFKFVQEYSRLPGQEEYASFGDVVRHISTKFGDGTMIGSSSSSYSAAWGGPRLSVEEQERRQHQQDRVLAANAAAAAFYADCLVDPQRVGAGGARSLLRSRGLASVATVRYFALGYAPDVYFGGGSSRRQPSHNKWGEGGLVDHLRGLNFTAREVLDAGLAVQTKKSQSQLQKEKNLQKTTALLSSDKNDTAAVEEEEEALLDYSSIMDRFRGRLMVPIFDRSGKNVLGFGGREIPVPDSEIQIEKKQSSDYYAPKYLNSPESVVFEKRKILFGQHVAQQAIRDAKKSSEIASTSNLLVVEGYLDAISLWTAGISSVVACMGTALSPEQLDEAARTAGSRGGRIVLCLDNDAAGTAAVGRLCSNGMLAAAATKNVVEIAVAQLPGGIKDPAEFFESRRSTGASATELVDQFRREVMDCAVDWTDWFIQRVVGEYDRNAPKGSAGSFSDIFERVADFLATSLRPADRTKRAYEVAGKLSELMANERNATEVSSAVSMQLESDLIDLAARISDAKEAIHRRAESASGFSSSEASSAVAAMARGHGPNSNEREDKLSSKARGKNPEKGDASALPDADGEEKLRRPETAFRSRAKVKQKPYRARMTRHKEVESLTPHFSGFRFNHQSDADWLGLNEKEKWKRKRNSLVLGHRPQTQRNGQLNFDSASPLHDDGFVYFNSADFNGHQFLTDDARSAGYASRRTIKPDASIVERGIASVVEQDISSMILGAEDALLRALVQCSPARTTAKNMLDARSAVSSAGDILWSCPAKEWLFKRLIGNSNELPVGLNLRPSELRAFFANLTDAPEGAFSDTDTIPQNHTSSVGSAGEVFVPNLLNGLQNSSTVGNNSSVLKSNLDSAGNTRGLSVDLTTTGGLLDTFFVEEAKSDDIVGGETALDSAGELLVQEILVNLLWVSTAMKANLLRKEISSHAKSAPEESSAENAKALAPQKSPVEESSLIIGSDEPTVLLDQLVPQDETDTNPSAAGDPKDLAAPSTPLEIEHSHHQTALLTQYRDTTRALHALKRSAQRITRQLMDQRLSDGVEGHMSAALQADLASRLDDHLREISGRQLPATTEPGSFAGDNDEPYEEFFERVSLDWGDFFDDDYFWSPSDGAEAAFPDLEGDLEETETLEEGLDRIDREWAGWLD